MMGNMTMNGTIHHMTTNDVSMIAGILHLAVEEERRHSRSRYDVLSSRLGPDECAAYTEGVISGCRRGIGEEMMITAYYYPYMGRHAMIMADHESRPNAIAILDSFPEAHDHHASMTSTLLAGDGSLLNRRTIRTPAIQSILRRWTFMRPERTSSGASILAPTKRTMGMLRIIAPDDIRELARTTLIGSPADMRRAYGMDNDGMARIAGALVDSEDANGLHLLAGIARSMRMTDDALPTIDLRGLDVEWIRSHERTPWRLILTDIIVDEPDSIADV